MDQEGIRRRMNERLEELRMEKKELAERSGDSYRNVQNWLAKTRVPADFVARYVVAVPVNPEWLLTGAGSANPPDEGLGDRLYSLLDRLLCAKLSADEKRELLRMYERILSEVEAGGA